MQTNRKLITVFVLATVAFMVAGSAASANAATIQKLPTCMDPTGQNLPCMMVISTLPPPPNALQCQETSGQLLPCSYTTQNLSNGEQIVAITVYVPASYVFTGYGPWTIVKQVVHETKTRIVHVPECPKGQTLDPKIHKCVDISYCPPPKGYHTDSITHNCVPDNCQPGWAYNPISGKCEPQLPKCERADSNAVTDLDKNLKTKDCDTGDANEHGMTPPPPPPSTCKDNTTCPYVNTTKSLASAAIQPSNTSIPASGKSGAGSTCVNNCTGTPPPVDCTKTPNDPSCTQTFTPSTTTPPSTSGTPPSPTTKTCPDGSVIDANANCPTQSTPTNPNTPSTPPSTSGTPPPSNNPSPPSGSNNGGGGSSSGSGGSGSGSGEGSGPSQPQ
jgi:uncharacterized membrane protein YgcG